MHLKNYVSLFLVSTLSLCAAENSSLLSALKQQKVEIDKQKNELESQNLKYDWINNIVGSYSYINSDQTTSEKKTGLFSVTIDQPIFKSGGIYFAIQYAGANREFLELSTKLSEQTLIKSVISSWLMIKRYDAQIQKQQALIANAKIDIIRKKEQYENGFLDSSFLDNAILNKGALEKALIDMESARFEQLMAFESLSDMDYTTIEPPKFMLVDEANFLENSLVIKQQNANSIKSDYLKKMTISNYLPTVSFTAGYYDSEIDVGSTNTKDAYRNFGLKVSMPLLSVNRGRTIEIRKLEALKAKLELDDVKRSEKSEYRSIVKKIELLSKKGQIALEDYKLYESLLNSTTELYSAGEKTIYDVDTLKNSKETMKFDKQIYDIDIQLSLLSLYAKMNGKI